MAHGRKDDGAVSHYLFNGFILCAITAVVISLSLVAGRQVLLHLGQDPEGALLALPFFKIIGFSIIPMLLFMTLKQFADGLELTKTAMLFSLSALPINIYLNWLLIYGNWGFPRMELVGAGWQHNHQVADIFALLFIILKHPTFANNSLAKKPLAVAEKNIGWILNIGIPAVANWHGAGFCSIWNYYGLFLQWHRQRTRLHWVVLHLHLWFYGPCTGGSIRVSNAFGVRTA